jgi:bifunctional UDP-N-acetylglucosamine pyrophosphorylase/glucosamine-1-phosphate N-acetyltransferase
MLRGVFLVMNGDIIASRQDIAAMAAREEDTIGIKEVADVSGLGVVSVDGEQVTSIIEKVDKPSSNLANTGIYLFTPAVFDAIEQTSKSVRGEYEITTSLQLMIEQGHTIGYQFLERWIDCSYPWDLLQPMNACLAPARR